MNPPGNLHIAKLPLGKGEMHGDRPEQRNAASAARAAASRVIFLSISANNRKKTKKVITSTASSPRLEPRKDNGNKTGQMIRTKRPPKPPNMALQHIESKFPVHLLIWEHSFSNRKKLTRVHWQGGCRCQQDFFGQKSAIGILRQLEFVMADTAQSYDEFAAHYDQIFENWEESMRRQAKVLGGILRQECRDVWPVRVLDCACGIGTQSLGLAMNGFDVEGCDTSPGAILRARSEASSRGLRVPFSVANMLQLSAIPRASFDAAICIDNSLPHLESDEQLSQAAQQAFGKLRVGGCFIGSIRDYDRLVVERPTIHGPSFFSEGGRRRIVFQIWDWLDERRYRFHLYITRSTESAWHTVHFTSTYRAVLRGELEGILHQVGFTSVRWLLPPDSGFYQPMFVANRNC